MKILVTHTLQRTIEVEVEDTDEQAAIAAAMKIAAKIQPADWGYTWIPTAEEGCVLPHHSAKKQN
jgi:hypothetical protein